MIVDVVIPYSADYTPRWMLDRLRDDIENQSIETNCIVIADEDAQDVAESRNLGLDRSENRYVAFADADDQWNRNKLERQLRSVQGSDATLCLTQTQTTDGTLNTRPTNDIKSFIEDVVFRRTMSFMSSMLVDTKRTDMRFNEDIYRREDHLYAIEVAADGGLCFVSDPLVTISKHSGGLSHEGEPNRSVESHKHVFERACDFFPDLRNKEAEYWAMIHHRVGRSHYYSGNYAESISHLSTSLRHRPSIKTFGAFGVSFVSYCWAPSRVAQ
jgi:glycosyltransferase involved in cell wall biosynthesis